MHIPTTNSGVRAKLERIEEVMKKIELSLCNGFRYEFVFHCTKTTLTTCYLQIRNHLTTCGVPEGITIASTITPDAYKQNVSKTIANEKSIIQLGTTNEKPSVQQQQQLL